MFPIVETLLIVTEENVRMAKKPRHHRPHPTRHSAAEQLRVEDWPMSRDEALMKGKAYYVGPKPCRMGHMWLRRTDSRACVMCAELARGCNQLRHNAGRATGNGIAEFLRSVLEAT